jgi:hypothetical protein
MFSLDHSLASMLMQKDKKWNECPTEFMSVKIQGIELDHPLVEKQYFDVHKAIKQFMHYIPNNHTKVIIPLLAIWSLFVQKE